MTSLVFYELAAFAAAVFFSALGALWMLAVFENPRRVGTKAKTLHQSKETIFLFDDNGLVDATPSAKRIVRPGRRKGADWSKLLDFLTPRFPGVEQSLKKLNESGSLLRESIDQTGHLKAEKTRGLIRITLSDMQIGEERADIDRQTVQAMENELRLLRSISEESRMMIWRQNRKGDVTWVNRAYVELVKTQCGPQAVDIWPLPALFDVDFVDERTGPTSHRIGLDSSEWSIGTIHYDVHATPLGEDMLLTAVDASYAVKAENQLRDFTQTLTKTFAHLTTGLAVFDQNRRLVLFNPALTDLTGLRTDFLASKPSLFGFLDRLRERSMIPEPRDYKSWRQGIADLEAEAANGTYSETWSLPNGQTFRVSGRPHPDGALAFFIEDISAEISLMRRFRAELDISQNALDSLEDAIAVFSASGVLTLSNNAYGDLWGDDPGTSLEEINVLGAMRTWMEMSAPSPVWGEFRDFAAQTQDREEWSAMVRLLDGRSLSCRFTPIQGGATLVRFSATPDYETKLKSVRQA